MTTIPKTFIRPRDGLRLRKPSGEPLKPGGELVVWNSYWQRRKHDGDIEVVNDDQVAQQPEAEPTAEASPEQASPASGSKPRRQPAKE